MLACCVCVLALDPSLDVSQYAHRTWRVRDGFTKGIITSLAQTPDGYLWIGTEFGLLRFDGVRPVPWEPPSGQQLSGTLITYLLAAHDGTLWIGTFSGLATWKDGKFRQVPELAGQSVTSLLEARDGTIWIGIFADSGGALCDIRSGVLHCERERDRFGTGVKTLYEDSGGRLWLGLSKGIWRWKPGAPQFFSVSNEPFGIISFAEDEQGQLLFGSHEGIQRLVNGRLEPYLSISSAYRRQITRMFRDHDGGLWVGTSEQGLVHVREHEKVDVFSAANALSGDYVTCFLEDREGGMWIATYDGIDHFREYAIPTISTKQGLSSTAAWSVLASMDGSVWIGTEAGLNHWENGQISPFENSGGSQKSNGKVNGEAPEALFQDSSGRVWVSTPTGKTGYLDADRFIPIPGVPSGTVYSITETPPGHIWIANQQAGLLQMYEGRVTQHVSWAGLGGKGFAKVITADPSGRGLWLGFSEGGVVYFADGKVRVSYSAEKGLGDGRVTDLRFGTRGALWAATAAGLSRIKDGQVTTLTSKNGLPCDQVIATMEGDDHSMWLNLACGLARITRTELDAWVARPGKVLSVKLFDASDGVRTHASTGGFQPLMTKSADGKIWFLPWDGVSIIDPRRLPFNKLPPPVHIEKITADRKSYDTSNGLRLPPHVRDLTIDYTALSLVVPEKIHFRYKLEGQDPDWREVVNDRQVQYSNVAPRHYTFRVMASNNSGVWNEAGASLEFSVLPAFYQTTWFRILCVFGFLVSLWSIYRLRIQQMQRQFNIALDARVNERTRIARELHDTLLQTFHGAMFQFQAARNLISRRPEEALRSLDDAISETKKALGESREAIQDLRSEPIAKGNLAEFLMSISPELAGSHSNEHPPVFDLIEEGERQLLSSTVSKEICRIALELLRNAYQHAHAQRIEAEIRYGDSMFRLRIRDNGRGIEPQVLKEGGKLGHWGLRGIRERADRIGARLDLWSEPGGGTEVQLLVPASVAYDNIRDSYRATLFRRVKRRA